MWPHSCARTASSSSPWIFLISPRVRTMYTLWCPEVHAFTVGLIWRYNSGTGIPNRLHIGGRWLYISGIWDSESRRFVERFSIHDISSYPYSNTFSITLGKAGTFMRTFKALASSGWTISSILIAIQFFLLSDMRSSVRPFSRCQLLFENGRHLLPSFSQLVLDL